MRCVFVAVLLVVAVTIAECGTPGKSEMGIADDVVKCCYPVNFAMFGYGVSTTVRSCGNMIWAHTRGLVR
jgi:hypothetical protein